MNESGNKTTVYLLGDSITQGLGSKKINFTLRLAQMLGENYKMVNLAYTGTTIDYALKLLDEKKIVADGPTICVILYGNVDAQIRPNREGRVFPRIPKRFQGGGMLMPRPFYSRSLLKRIGQSFDNLARKAFAALIKAVDGTEQWVSLDSFSRQYQQLIERLKKMGVAVIACSCVYIDERLFPGSPAEYLQFDNSIRSHAERNEIPYIDFRSLFEAKVISNGWDCCFNKDHFHPNGAGYELMAKKISEVIIEKEL